MSKKLMRFAAVSWTLAIFFLAPLLSGYASDPDAKAVFQDPAVARLQQGRKQLTNGEEEELKKYGHTALEIITYAQVPHFPGKKDWDVIMQVHGLGSDGHVRAMKFVQRTKWCYDSYKDLLTYEGIQPGDPSRTQEEERRNEFPAEGKTGHGAHSEGAGSGLDSQRQGVGQSTARGRHDGLRLLVIDQGGFGIFNADSAKKALSVVMEWPLYPFFSLEIKPLCDWSYAYDQLLELWQK